MYTLSSKNKYTSFHHNDFFHAVFGHMSLCLSFSLHIHIMYFFLISRRLYRHTCFFYKDVIRSFEHAFKRSECLKLTTVPL